MHIQQLHL